MATIYLIDSYVFLNCDFEICTLNFEFLCR